MYSEHNSLNLEADFFSISDGIEYTSFDNSGEYIVVGGGAQVVSAGSGDDEILIYSDAGEPDPAQTLPGVGLQTVPPSSDKANDIISGGLGANKFTFNFLLNATEKILLKHTKVNGAINWMGVAHENDYVHAHWVEGIGNDIILDFSRQEGDSIVVRGHTVVVGSMEYVDSTTSEDGYTLIHVISQQGDYGGAHDEDPLGTIRVFGDEVTREDIIVERAGVFDGIDRFEPGISRVVDEMNSGDEGSNLLFAESDSEIMHGGNGDDLLLGSGGNDTLLGGDGKDALHGGDGADLLFGGNQVDALFGGQGDDQIMGGDGDDVLFGEDGNDTLEGENGENTIDGGAGNDLLKGGRHADTFLGGAGNDIVFGASGDDVIDGGDGDDLLVGGNGNDTIIDSAGSDTMRGKSGSDTFQLNSAEDLGNVIDDFEVGVDTLQLFTGVDTLVTQVGYDAEIFNSFGTLVTLKNVNVEELVDSGSVVADNTFASAERVLLIEGTDASDDLLGSSAGELIQGLGGSDIIRGVGGENTIEGGAGNDLLYGGGHADEILGGADSDIIFGGRGDDVLDGGVGDDTVVGGIGDDTLVDSSGADIMRGKSGEDTFLFADATDLGNVISDFEVGLDKIELLGALDVTLSQAGGNVEVATYAGVMVTMENVDLSELTEADLIYTTGSAEIIFDDMTG